MSFILFTEITKEPKVEVKTLSEKITNWIGTPYSIVLHSLCFVGIYGLHYFFDVPYDRVNLILTTAVSLEAIYLSLLIQMTVNRQAQSLQDVQEDVEEIAEDVGEIAEDVEGLEEDVDKIQKEVGELGDDLEEIAEDVGEIAEDVEEINEDEDEEESAKRSQKAALSGIETTLEKLILEIESMKQNLDKTTQTRKVTELPHSKSKIEKSASKWNIFK